MKFEGQQSDNLRINSELNGKMPTEEQGLLSVMNSAVEVAQCRNYLQAEALLVPFIEKENCRMEVLDLMARIYAQQGKYQQAQKLWLLLIKDDPSNLHAISALRTCAIRQKPAIESFSYQYSWLLILVLFWLILVISILIS
jgi:tetratricopeptide (TPR) repeat protein